MAEEDWENHTEHTKQDTCDQENEETTSTTGQRILIE